MKQVKLGHIYGAGEYGSTPPPYRLSLDGTAEREYSIAADGGYEYAEKHGIHIDRIIGDFDSAKVKLDASERVTVLPQEKDITDMYAAANIALEQGYDVLHIYGGTGGRFDHTFANVQLLKHISGQGARGYMFTAEKTEQPMQVITVITNSCITFPKEYRGYVSVFALDEKCEGVTIRGLKYTLDNAELYNNYPLGVSNEFTGTESCIDVKSGSAAIIFDYNDYNI